MIRTLITSTICIAAVGFASAVYAEKGAETLVRLSRGNAAPRAEAVADAAHGCAKCTDKMAPSTDKAVKTAQVGQGMVATHGCGDCGTKVVTEGFGKAKHDVVIHTCTMVKTESCCAKK